MLVLFIVVSPCLQAAWRSMKSTEELQSKAKLEMNHLLQSPLSNAASHSVSLSLQFCPCFFFSSHSNSFHNSVIFTGLKFLLIFSPLFSHLGLCHKSPNHCVPCIFLWSLQAPHYFYTTLTLCVRMTGTCINIVT